MGGERHSAAVQALDEQLLQSVSGGISPHGSISGYNENEQVPYRCPQCGKPVQFSLWLRYFCEGCDESWYDASALIPDANIQTAGMSASPKSTR